MISLEKIRLDHQKNINLFREWFHVVQDLNPTYLQAEDYELAWEVYIALGISWPDRNEDELQRLMKSRGPRRIIRHGIDFVTAKAFDKRLELAEKALLAAGFERFDVVGNWRKSDVVDAEFDPDFQEVKGQKDHAELAHRVGRAVAVFLDYSSSVSDEVLQAIVLIERMKP